MEDRSLDLEVKGAHTLFHYRLTGTLGKAKLLGMLACVAVGFVGLLVPALALAGALIVVLLAVIGSGYLVASRAREQGESLHEARR